jgi:hypothetical protein
LKQLFLLAMIFCLGISFFSPVRKIFSSSHKRGDEISTNISKEEIDFRKTLRDVILQSIFCQANCNHIENFEFDKVRKFIIELCDKGDAQIEGPDKECRFVYGTTQGAIEDALTKLLVFGEIQSVKTIILAPLPTTPLRKEGNTKNISKIPFDKPCQHTVDMREHTLRSLRSAGSPIIAAYSSLRFETWKKANLEGTKEQLKTWTKEKKHPLVIDMPLNVPVPQEMVGALYLITDKNGNHFYLPTSGVQPSDAGPDALWEMWLSDGNNSSVGTKRAQSMLLFIEQHGGKKIDF